MRVMRRTYRAARGAERELEGWAAIGILACLLIIAFAVVLATFLIPAAVGGVVWLAGLLGGSDRTKLRGARIAGWPWCGLSRAIYRG